MNLFNMISYKPKIKIGVIDSGIYPHKDIIGNLTTGYNFIDNNTVTWFDDLEHGTNVSGILTYYGNNTLVPLKVFSRDSYDVNNIIRAIDYCNMHNIKIINFCHSFFEFNYKLYNAIKNYRGLFICSSGNDSINIDKIKKYPLSFELDNIISVSSINSKKTPSLFSNYGKNTVHISALGENIQTTNSLIKPMSSLYKTCTGTSFAVPFVTNAVSIIETVLPGVSQNKVKKIILHSAKKNPALKGYNKCDGYLDMESILSIIS